MALRYILYLLLLLPLLLLSCKEKQNSGSTGAREQELRPADSVSTDETYFSITDYFADQWSYRRGDPYTLLRLEFNGHHADSSYIPLDSALWFSLTRLFEQADISAPSFLGKYDFDMLEDHDMELIYLYYQARSPELYMQKMSITANLYNNRIKTVYIETKTQQNDILKRQKLQYIPDRSFQVQQFEKETGKPEKQVHIEYLFKY